jgi:hypothetical protein
MFLPAMLKEGAMGTTIDDDGRLFVERGMGCCRRRQQQPLLHGQEPVQEDPSAPLERWTKLVRTLRRTARLRRIWSSLGQHIQALKRHGGPDDGVGGGLDGEGGDHGGGRRRNGGKPGAKRGGGGAPGGQ